MNKELDELYKDARAKIVGVEEFTSAFFSMYHELSEQGKHQLLVHASNTYTNKDILMIITKQVALEQWKSLVTINGMLFAPSDGKCWSCKADLVKHWQDTGSASPTGCPKCNRSFVD